MCVFLFAHLRIFEFRVSVDSSITNAAVQTIHYHCQFNCWINRIRLFESFNIAMRDIFIAHLLSMAVVRRRRIPFSVDRAASMRPAQSQRLIIATGEFAPAYLWWLEMIHKDIICPRLLCTPRLTVEHCSHPKHAKSHIENIKFHIYRTICQNCGCQHTWNSRNAYPFGGKYDFDSALCGQSTTSGPKRRNDEVISSVSKERRKTKCPSIMIYDLTLIVHTFCLPSSMSGGSPPTNTFREKRSVMSEFCDCGDERAGEPSGSDNPS